jgi:hypothetical protein
MQVNPRTILNRWTLPVLLLPLLVGCCTSVIGDAVSIAKRAVPAADDVAVILLEPNPKPNGSYYPKTQIVRKDSHMVVWVTEGDSLQVEWKPPKPLGVEITCVKFLCYTKAPFHNVNEHDKFGFKATIQCKGKDPVTIDPIIEIVF